MLCCRACSDGVVIHSSAGCHHTLRYGGDGPCQVCLRQFVYTGQQPLGGPCRLVGLSMPVSVGLALVCFKQRLERSGGACVAVRASSKGCAAWSYAYVALVSPQVCCLSAQQPACTAVCSLVQFVGLPLLHPRCVCSFAAAAVSL